MTEPTFSSIVDRLRRHKATEEASQPLSATPSISAEERLGLRFKPGDRVLDTATGKRGSVVAGRPGVTSAGPMYEINFTEGRLVTRSESELVLDSTPTPAPGR